MSIRAIFLGLGALAACGDNGVTSPASPDAGPLVTRTCAGETLATVDLTGIYHARLTLEGSESASAFRFDPAGDGFTIALGGEVVPITRSAQAVVAHQGTSTDGRTVTIDHLADDCSVSGTWQRCRGGQCYDYALAGKRVDRLDEAPAHGLTLVSEYVGTAADPWTAAGLPVNVRVADKIAYVANYWDGLRIVDVHDPAHPVELGHAPAQFGQAGEIYNDVKIIDEQGKRFALMASSINGVVPVDVSDPAHPVDGARFGTGNNVHTVFVDGGRVYLGASGGGLEIWDLADPAHAVKLGGWLHPNAPSPSPYLHDLYVHGDRAYLNYWDSGMTILDVSDPAHPEVVGEYANYGQHTSHSNWVTQVGARMISVHGDEQWDAHVHIVDVTEGTAGFATGIGEWRTRPEVSVHNIMAFGSRAYMAHYQDGVRVLDLSDPTAPVAIAWFNTWPGYDTRYGSSFFEGAVGIDVDLDAKLVYVADSHRGLMILHLDV
ncbi:MAG: hypothetical protein K8W52_43360 [Deltaproteobacteria bacterium]|nr:hypothetical protein [Deltaproteobacteria bacterium]